MRIFFITIILLLAAGSLTAQEVMPLWPGQPPMAREGDEVPTLILYPADAATAVGAAVVICPGGGYVRRAEDHEGHQVAKFFNSFGVSAFIVTYRVGTRDGSGPSHPIPFLDASRAVRTVRARSEEWGHLATRVGIMGFSAGGHLAATVGTQFDDGHPEATDAIERVSSRPNFLILGYPVISFTEPFTHRGSRRALLGENAPLDLVKSLSNEYRVSGMTPPAFLVHTTADRGVPPENSIAFYLALRKAGVPAELHIYERGRHGLGLGGNDAVFATWPDRLRDWMQVRGLLTKP